LVVGLDRDKPHPEPTHGFCNCFRINEVVLVCFYMRLYILCRPQPYVMTLLPERSPKKCDPPHASIPITQAGRFAVNRRNCRRENFFRTTTSPHAPMPTECKIVFAKINANGVYFHEVVSFAHLFYSGCGRKDAADQPIN
jgi:hypothetical protein